MAEEEAWDFILRSDGLWDWRSVCNSLTKVNVPGNPDFFTWVQTRASIFIQFGRELSTNAYEFDHADTHKLWEIFAALQRQLRTLGNFSLIYSRKFGETLDRNVPIPGPTVSSNESLMLKGLSKYMEVALPGRLHNI